MSSKKYLFVDLPHLAHRCAFAQSDLTYNDKPVGMMYGVLRSLFKYRQMFPMYHIVLAKDAGHYRRDQESRDAVIKGIIPETYKENRVKKPDDLVQWQMAQQWEDLDYGLSLTSCQLVYKSGFEADDIIASYVLGCENSCVIITSDHDYYQLLEPGVIIQDDMKHRKITFESLKEDYNLEAACQWVDVGALQGDAGDNIFGVPGIGEKTAAKLIAQHGDWKSLIMYLKSLYESIREQYPDVKGEEFQKLRNIRTPAEEIKFQAKKPWKGKYADIREDFQYTGVALALEEGVWKPSGDLAKSLKNNLLLLMFQERIALAYSLKQMDVCIEGLPLLTPQLGSASEYEKFLDQFGFGSLAQSTGVLT